MKKLMFLITIPAALLFLAAPYSSNAQKIVFSDKYDICKTVALNTLCFANVPWAWPNHAVIRDVPKDECRLRPTPRCLDRTEPPNTGARKKPPRKEQ